MPMFRKKPVVIEARQFETNNHVRPGAPNMDAIVLWMNQGQDRMVAWHNGTNIYVPSVELGRRLEVGDWIVRYESGRIEVFSDELFKMTYEAA